MKLCKHISVDVSTLPVEEALYAKLFPICKTRIEERSGAIVEEGTDGFTVTFLLDEAMQDEAFIIADTTTGISITGKNFNALMFGMGQFLHKSKYDESGIHVTDWRGFSAPECPFRVIYFAIHFFNSYFTATPEMLCRYFEDLMLWGFNGVCGVFSKINLTGWDDPDVERCFALVEKLFGTAKSLNMYTVTMANNVDFRVPDLSVAADKTGISTKAGNLICPAKPGGYERIRSIVFPIMERLTRTGLDYIVHFPYDEGGCSCENCAPWGGNGYYRLAKRLHKDLQEHVNPNLKAILSTWHFGLNINDPRDFEWLDRAIREDREQGDDWVTYMMLETRRGMHEYIREHGAPGGVPAIDFPEITMLKLEPWGGFGANPLPTELERIWREGSHLMHGGLPYSEGIYDDLNKAVISGFLWQKDRSTAENFDDYCRYEFRDDIRNDLWEMSVLMEKNQLATHVSEKRPPDMEEVARILELGKKIDAALPEFIRTGWRWRLIYIRSVLDYERYTAGAASNWGLEELVMQNRFQHWGKFLVGNETAQTVLRELIDIYNMPLEYIPEFHVLHHYVRPPYTPLEKA